ncbi:MAG: hypothetical protein ACM3MH_08265 [Actinomycetota bacterium]
MADDQGDLVLMQRSTRHGVRPEPRPPATEQAITSTPHDSLGRCSPELLGALEEAFTGVWRILYAHMPTDGDAAEELRSALSRTLLGLVAEGITDPNDLRRKALENMALRR